MWDFLLSPSSPTILCSKRTESFSPSDLHFVCAVEASVKGHMLIHLIFSYGLNLVSM